MKKIISMVLTVSMLLALTVSYVSADTLISYEADFEPESSYVWISDCNGAPETLPYGTNLANIAYKLTENQKIGTLSYGTVKDAPLTGLSVFTYDFYPESTSFADHDNASDYNSARIYTDSGDYYAWKFIKRGSKLGVAAMGSFGTNEVTVDFDTWTRLVLVYNPTTGLGDFTVIKNVDTANAEATTFTDITVSAANQTKLDRFYIYSNRANTVYVDNIAIRQIPAVLAQTAAMPANGATDVAVDSDVSFTFNNALASANLKINDAAASFAVSGNTVSFAGELAGNTAHTVTGYVTDIYGVLQSVNHSFTTKSAPISHTTGFESGEAESYSSWADGSDGTTQVLAYGADSNNTAYYMTAGKKFGSVSFAQNTNLKQYPLTGLSVIAYDIYPVGTSFSDDVNYTAYRLGQIYPDAADISTKDYYVWGMIKRNDQVGIAAMLDYGNTEVKVDFDTWTRLVLVYNPATGFGDFTVIKNVDTANAEATTFAGVKVTDANLTKIDRFYIRSQSNNSIYLDNVTIGQIPAALVQTAATPANGAENVTADSGISFTFNNDIASTNLKINGTAVNFAVSGNTVSYTGLEEGKAYAVTGFVTDIYGMVQQVKHSFTMVAGAVSYIADFETDEWDTWADLTNTDTVEPVTADWAKIVTKAYGENNDNKAIELKTGADQYKEIGKFDTLSYGTVIDNPICGNSVLSIDFMIDPTGWETLDDWTNTHMINITMTDAETINAVRLMKHDDNKGFVVLLPDDTHVGVVQPDVWNRITMAYYPKTGNATFAVISNADGNDAALEGVVDYQLSEAEAVEGINRLTLTMNRPGIRNWYDNIKLYEQDDLLKFENTRFVDGNGDVVADGKSVAKPTYKTKITNNTAAPEEMTLFITAMEDGVLKEVVMENISIPAGGSADISKSFTAEDVKSCDIKAFIWRLDSLIPVAESLVPMLTLQAAE